MKKIVTLTIAALFVFSACIVMIGTEAEADDPIPTTNWKDYEFADTDKAWYATNPSATSFTIKTAAELAYLAVLVAGTDNFGDNTISFEPAEGTVDLSEHQWTPIGAHRAGFYGTFNGNDNTISGIIIADDGEYTGLFGESEGRINNLKITDSTITSGEFVGIVVGLNIGIVSECSVTDSTVKGNQMIGGLVGHNQGEIEYSYNTGNVEANMRIAGGIAGDNENNISDCYNTGNITGPTMVGGIAGSSLSRGDSAEIVDCYNTGTIGKGNGSNDISVGGITGKTNGLVEGCYNTGDVEGNAPIIGEDEGATEDMCYWLTKSDGDGGLTQDQMTGAEALTNMSNLRNFTWEAKENEGKLSYLPQLVAFTTNNDDTKVQADSLKSVTIDERTASTLTKSAVYVFIEGEKMSDVDAGLHLTADVDGKFTWAEPDRELNDIGDFKAIVKFAPTEEFEYLPAEIEVDITVTAPLPCTPEPPPAPPEPPAPRNNNSEETMMVIAGVIAATLIAAICVVHFRGE